MQQENDAKNIDENEHYPSKTFDDSNKENKYWIVVGASNRYKNKKLPASFSNYGVGSVDIFAPGVDIYSSVPNNKYEDNSGTSMAAPVVTGVVALILNYYPDIDRSAVKQLLQDAGTDFGKKKVLIPNEDGASVKARMSELSNSGKVVNAAEALRMAESL